MKPFILNIASAAESLIKSSEKPLAYLDPGSGSFILQLLLASLVGVGFALRGYWSKITGILKKDSETETLENDDTTANPQ